MKRGLIILTILSILIISGCAQFNIPTPNLQNLQLGQLGNQKQIVESKGLLIKFRENQPPLNEIYAGKDFKISMELSNNDPSESSGTIYLSDTPSDDFSSLRGREQQSFSLPPAEVLENQANKLVPSSDVVAFGPYQYDPTKVFSGMVTNFIIEITANHKVTVPAQICVTSSASQQSRCPNKETITNFGSNAKYSPVTISKIEKTLIPEENGLASLILKIYIANLGKGKIDNNDQSLNSFKVNLQGSSNLDCAKSNKISLKEGEKVIVCTADVSISDELFRQDILEIDFDYPYKIIETLGPIKVTKLENL